MKIKATSIFIVIFSILCGVLTHDYILGTLVVMCGMFDCYLTSVGKVSNYIFGIGYTLISAYLYFMNGQYGLTFVSLFIFVPVQIGGVISWLKKMDRSKTVKTRKFNLKTSIIVVTSCVLGSIALGNLLSMIPGQQLAFLDATSNVLCLSLMILMNLRYCENWYLYLLTNITDLTIWIINFSRGGEGALVMVIVSVWYIIFNIYGIYNWYKLNKKNKTNK